MWLGYVTGGQGLRRTSAEVYGAPRWASLAARSQSPNVMFRLTPSNNRHHAHSPLSCHSSVRPRSDTAYCFICVLFSLQSSRRSGCKLSIHFYANERPAELCFTAESIRRLACHDTSACWLALAYPSVRNFRFLPFLTTPVGLEKHFLDIEYLPRLSGAACPHPSPRSSRAAHA